MHSAPTVDILLVDDHPENLVALEAILSPLDVTLVKANSGEEALRRLLHQDFAVILLDVQMPGMDGFEAATLIRARPRSHHIPIIFLTAFSSNESLIFKGYSLGAVDYLLKPIDPQILTSKVAVFVDLFKKTAAIRQQTAQLQAVNAQLHESQERLQDFLDNANDLIQIVSPQGQFLYVNRTWQRLLNYNPSETEQLFYLDIIQPQQRDAFLAACQSIQTKHRNQQLETVFVAKDGREIAVEGNLNCRFENGKPSAIRCLFHDITERRQAEAARAQFIQEQAARQQAEVANRMKDEFLATLSHELRTPLNSMLGWAKLLRTRKFDEPTTARALETIERNAQSQAQLIEDMLDVSRIVTGKLHLNLHPVNLLPILEAVLDIVQPALEAKRVTLECWLNGSPIVLPRRSTEATAPEESSLPPCRVLGDSQRLQQVVWNLLSNAIKFTPEEGQIRVQLQEVMDNGGETAPSAASAAPSSPAYAQITIQDTGIGISADFLPYVFDRFRQADATTTRSHGGLGLGLAIVKQLVDLHNGRVWATSEGPDQGTTFTVQLPLVSNADNGGAFPEQGEEQAGLPSPSLKLNGLQVLAVDDELDARELLTVVLEQFGAQVQAVPSAAAALAALEQQPPDILLSDIGMPEEDGYALIQKVRAYLLEQDLSVPAIALTAYAAGEDSARLLAAGFQAHLTKPFEPEQLAQVVASLTGRAVDIPS
jgi:PAS domain S-box-containing protein